MTKFLNISTDNTLGGATPSDVTVSSQKAIKEYVDSHSGGGGASYQAGTGIDITDDTISVVDPVLINQTVEPEAQNVVIGEAHPENIESTTIDIGGSTDDYQKTYNSVCIGANADKSGITNSVLIGAQTYLDMVAQCVIIGSYSRGWAARRAIAIGFRAGAHDRYGIQLGGSPTSSSWYFPDENCFHVGNENGNFKMMLPDGTIPVERFTTVPTTAGTYSATITVDDSGNITRSWESAGSGGGGLTNPITFEATDGDTTYQYTSGFNANNRFYTTINVGTNGGGSSVPIPSIYTMTGSDGISVNTTTESNSTFESVRNFAIALGDIDCGELA